MGLLWDFKVPYHSHSIQQSWHLIWEHYGVLWLQPHIFTIWFRNYWWDCEGTKCWRQVKVTKTYLSIKTTSLIASKMPCKIIINNKLRILYFFLVNTMKKLFSSCLTLSFLAKLNFLFFFRQYDLTGQHCPTVTLLFDRHYNTVTVIFGQD